MAGKIDISKAKSRDLFYHMSGGDLRNMADYLQSYIHDSPVLMADDKFKQLIHVAPFGDWLPLNQCSDLSVAEVARLLSRVLDPAHPYWEKEAIRHIVALEEFKRECAEAGTDPYAQIRVWQEDERKGYREIISLIGQRLASRE